MHQRYGQFEIIGVLSEIGGMGIVYRAIHVVLRRPAVIKVLRPHFASSPEIVQRFRGEAMAAAALRHRNIVDVLDCGQAEDGQWYIALEFLDGLPLSKLIASNGGPIDPWTIVEILGPVCNALHRAHEAGIVHRDVKPDNIFLTQEQGVKLLDFGIAKLAEGLADSQGNAATGTGVMMGTPAYMAPEQLLDSKTVDRRSDVYALGVILYEMTTGGWLPWGHGTPPVQIYQLQKEHEPPDPRQYQPGLSEELVFVIRKAMAFAPHDRWANTRELALALAEAAPSPGPGYPSGMEILQRHAVELTVVSSDAVTVGHRVPSGAYRIPSGSHRIATPVSGTPVTAPFPPVTGAPATAQHGASPRSGATPMPGSGGWAAPPVSAAPVTTTLGSAASQSVPPTPPAAARPGARRWPLIAAAGAVAVSGVFVAAVALATDSEPSVANTTAVVDAQVAAAGAPDATSPAATTSAVAIVTEPSGAAVFIDGVARGAAPANLALPAGSTITVRAELAGHAPAEQIVQVSAVPSTVRLVLSALATDAGVVDARLPDARVTTSRPRRDAGTGSSSENFDLNDVGGD